MVVVLTFESVHRALEAEHLARSTLREIASSPPELLPLPASVKSDCGFGLSIEFGGDSVELAMRELAKAGITFVAAYKAAEKERRYERID